MGRKPTRWTNLPRGMRARERGTTIYYFLDTGGKPRKEIPLGTDYIAAVKKWAELTSQRNTFAVFTFPDLVQRYRDQALSLKAPRSQIDNEKQIVNLLKFFGDPPAPLDSIEPVHIRQYMDWRVQEARKAAAERFKKLGKPVPQNHGGVQANREKALISHMWNFARERGITARPNPCTGVKGYKESGRDVVVGDDHMARVLAVAGKPLEFALRLAALTGQRPADVLHMSESHIADGMLHVRQGKTAAKLRIEITGALADLLAEIARYKAQFKVRALALLVNEDGQPLTKYMFRTRFDAARDDAGIPKSEFQFRDMRATAATGVDEATGIKHAQALLGHTTEAMTADYIRHKVGKKAKPAR